jgi:hypothetical protein
MDAKGKFTILKRFLIENVAVGGHCYSSFRTGVPMPGVSLGQPFQKDDGKLKAGLSKSPGTQRLTMSGGKDGSVLTLLCPQTFDLAGDYGIGRSIIVRLGTGSDGSAWSGS